MGAGGDGDLAALVVPALGDAVLAVDDQALEVLPPVTTSMRSIISGEMSLKSTMLVPGTPGTKRRPLTSTRVRESPRLRRLTVVMPFSLTPKPELVGVMPDTPAAGRWRMMLPMLASPVLAIALASTTDTGVGASRLGRAMREPVTTISETWLGCSAAV